METISRKICMVGDFGVGKTSSVSRFVHNVYSEKYQTTIGVKVDTKEVDSADQKVKMVIWDIAGRNKFGNVEFTYLRGSAGYLLVVDGTRSITLDTAMALRTSIEARYGELPFVMLLNKADLEDSWQIDDATIENLRKEGIPIFITSAKTGDQIEQAFIKLTELLQAS
ncbi:MAG: GTP-binding protein [Gammaproteobacteria bacterium]|nr:GTP-binding protein [Gammaproteobacteria bacterium]NNC96958.1 GTP-binding protein [Gammaproteobacteria bacterium]NNM14572.1 GTP-binding protein [Gammaproteobacteria bacterium]